MAFRPEPTQPTSSNALPRTAVLWCNLGSPDAPTAKAVRPYLAQFLSDQRVVELPAALWQPILRGIILRTRPAKSAAKYASIWLPEGSPLKVWSARQAVALRGLLDSRGHAVQVQEAMRYGQPAIGARLDALKAEGVQRVLVLPAYPQYSGTTTASVIDAVNDWSRDIRRLPEFRFVADYHDDPGYIDALAHSVQRHWQANGRGDMLLMSFHGVPERTAKLGDPYSQQCMATAGLLAQRLQLSQSQWRVSFQSRFGKAKWLEPSTEAVLHELGGQGTHRLDVMCPGFTSDCLETLEEIAMEGRDTFVAAGGREYRYIPCLNDDAEWIDALAAIAQRHMGGWPTQRTAAGGDAGAGAVPKPEAR
ncbi:ferrochelatase [Variovorax dokdonensis]|uniref:Ferrochelatase n=1 Tax=Variovorax dokdonensis TaxID=344883 RepID=A0ABT7N8C3_9BURK|nr:ferrochelatase [Variovorax dokdonensis]MDM0044184.1 ferrochelatase [Variovorax dokdonensis]